MSYGRTAAPVDRKRGWTYFLVANAIALVLAAVVFGTVWYGGFLGRGIQVAYEFFIARPALAVAAALSPLFTSILIGWAYGQRSRRGKKYTP